MMKNELYIIILWFTLSSTHAFLLEETSRAGVEFKVTINF